MRRLKASYWFMCILVLDFFPWRVLASEGLDIPEGLDKKVPLEGLSGLSLFFSKLYNENLWLYAILCTFLMAAVGVTIAFVADLILKAMGMETEKIEHNE